MTDTIDHPCYTDDWKRTNPDLVVYLPKKPGGPDEYADHLHVEYLPGGDLLAIWSTGTYESSPDGRILCSRSKDEGQSWTEPMEIDGPTAPGMIPALAFPVFSKSGRIYLLYNQNLGISEFGSRFTGPLRVQFSDDEGRTWQRSGVDIPWRRTRFDHPDPKVPCNCIVWQKPIRDAKGRWIVGFSRWSSPMAYPRPVGGNRNHLDTQCELMRFDNIDEGPHPTDIKITWLPNAEGAIRVSPQIEPEASRGYSLAEEPGIVLLPDGRLWMNMRTVTGRIWYTVSDDDGHSWRKPAVLRYQDGGAEVLHPKSPDPIYRLQDGRYILFFHNHDGFSYGATGPWDMNARRPLFMTVGEFRKGAHQPIWFSQPKFMADTQCVGIGVTGLIWLAMYASFTERNGQRVFWYADRKHFLLGRRITDELLEDMTVLG